MTCFLGNNSRRFSRESGFTLLEMLVVIALLSLLLVALVPAVNSLSKSSGRKGAISNLTSTIEQARSLALSDSRNTYVAFARTVPGANAVVTQDYSYRGYAVFEDDASATNKVQVTKWQKLPTGISFRSLAESGNTGTCITPTTNATTATFAFPPSGIPIVCPYIEFDSTGAVIQPTTVSPMRLVVFEGTVSNDVEAPTAREPSGDPVRDEIQIAKFTGRAKYVVQ